MKLTKKNLENAPNGFYVQFFHGKFAGQFQKSLGKIYYPDDRSNAITVAQYMISIGGDEEFDFFPTSDIKMPEEDVALELISNGHSFNIFWNSAGITNPDSLQKAIFDFGVSRGKLGEGEFKSHSDIGGKTFHLSDISQFKSEGVKMPNEEKAQTNFANFEEPYELDPKEILKLEQRIEKLEDEVTPYILGYKIDIDNISINIDNIFHRVQKLEKRSVNDYKYFESRFVKENEAFQLLLDLFSKLRKDVDGLMKENKSRWENINWKEVDRLHLSKEDFGNLYVQQNPEPKPGDLL